jgi:hypothetical protein
MDALKKMETAVVESDVANSIASGVRQGSASATTNNPFATPTPAAPSATK